MKTSLKQLYNHLEKVPFGVFGSVLSSNHANDLDIFLVCRKKTEVDELSEMLARFPDLVSVSFNGYGTGGGPGGGKRKRAIDITLFDNAQSLQDFLAYDNKNVQPNVGYTEFLKYWNKVS